MILAGYDSHPRSLVEKRGQKRWRGSIDFCKGSPGAGLFNIHASGGWAEMAGNHPCTNIGGQTFNKPSPPLFFSTQAAIDSAPSNSLRA